MRLFIPELGTKLILTKDFTANITYESRNDSILKTYFPEIKSRVDEAVQRAQENCYLGWPGIFKKYGYNYEEIGGYEKNAVLAQELRRRHNEDRKALFEEVNKIKEENPCVYTFKKGTVLEVDRIYIRKGNEEFSSLTFKWRTGKKVLRFWLKLEDVNRIEFDLVS